MHCFVLVAVDGTDPVISFLTEVDVEQGCLDKIVLLFAPDVS